MSQNQVALTASAGLAGYFGTGPWRGYGTKHVADATFTEYERGSACVYMNQCNYVGKQWQSDYKNGGNLELMQH